MNYEVNGMEIKWERIDGFGLIQTVTNDGETFFNLADAMDALELKPSWKNGIEKQPVRLSGRIVWGLRFVDGSYFESVFIDKDGLENLVNRC